MKKLLKNIDSGTLIIGKGGSAIHDLKIFAATRADAKDKKLFNPTESSDVLSYVREKADFFIELPEYEGCRILGLSTCSDGASTDRIIVFAYILE